MDNFDIREVKIGQEIEVIKNNSINVFRVLTVNSNCLLVQRQISGAESSIFTVGDTIEICISIDSTTYRCHTKVLGSKFGIGFENAVLNKPVPIIKSERRKYYRLPVKIEVDYCELPDDKKYESISNIPFEYFSRMKKTLSVDLSGGGLRIDTEENIECGRKLLVKFSLNETITSICKVMRSERNTEDLGYRLGLKYETIDEHSRDKINYFVFKNLKSIG